MKKIFLIIITVYLSSCRPITGNKNNAAIITNEPILVTETSLLNLDRFSFVYTDYLCDITPHIVVNTEKHILLFTPLIKKETTNIVFTFTDKELLSIYNKIIEIDFFSYPSIFVIPDYYADGLISPVYMFRLDVKSNEKQNSVTWKVTNTTARDYQPATQLKALQNLLWKTIFDHPEISKLSKQLIGCL